MKCHGNYCACISIAQKCWHGPSFFYSAPRFRPWPFFSLRALHPQGLRQGEIIRMRSLSVSERASPKRIPQKHTLV